MEFNSNIISIGSLIVTNIPHWCKMWVIEEMGIKYIGTV